MTSLSPAVADAVRCRWPDRASVWIESLPNELAEVCAALAVTPTGRTFSARSAHVIEATSRSGTLLILRSSPDPAAAHQAAVSERLAALDLAPALHLVSNTPTSTWTAMDAISPGTSLVEQEPTPSQLARVTEMLGVLRSGSGPASAPGIVPWLHARLTEPPADDQPPHRGPAAEEQRRAGLDMLDQLADDLRPGLCHGDLSPPNVLHGGRRLWFIDPRGMNGEAAYDIAVLALKLSYDDLDTARALARSIALGSGDDPDRAAGWTVVADAATV